MKKSVKFTPYFVTGGLVTWGLFSSIKEQKKIEPSPEQKSLNAVLNTNTFCRSFGHWSDAFLCTEFKNQYQQYRNEILRRQDWRYPNGLDPKTRQKLEIRFDDKYLEKQIEKPTKKF